ncbi:MULTISPECIES: ATP-binding protein [unclassified Streptomyces]|uniref:ATP-binding protein n=1 Tax=unclassified Streptomyces TaxID=2593676 RepID=UPI000DADCEE8|nr:MULTISPECIES: ATP-binding protein [unclassified Streptomyces]PZT72735.1 ATP-binding protein [Streptomyces sp. AC1-42T]PZT80946.1 ATP-binding protein [Streptomyces sp. AC1-42W]
MIEQWRASTSALCAPPVGPPRVLLLAGEPQSAKAARDFAREFVSYHVPGVSGDYVETVVLIACELVTNSIRYGTEPGDSVRVVPDADDARTRIEVHDPVRRHPRLRPVSCERERGRGLVLLDALCPGAWGVYDIPFGKSVWAEVKAP